MIRKSHLHIVGKRLYGPDDEAKASGTIVYADDFTMEGMLYAKVFRSTRASAKIKSLDTAAAKSLPGVVAVVTAEDVPNNRPLTSGVVHTAATEDTTSVGLLKAAERVVLADDRVRFYGQPIALVAAEDPDIAEVAFKLIEIEYEDLPGVFDPEEAMKDGVPKVDGGSNIISRWKLRKGDVRKGFREADVIVENTYKTQFVEPAQLEAESGIAWVDEDGVLNLQVATQVIEQYRDIARILAIPEDKVRIIGTLMGGGFGGKVDPTVEPYIALLSWKTGRPVKLTYKREEIMYGRYKRHPFRMWYKHGATRDGKLVAMKATLIADSGALVSLSPGVLFYSTVHSTGPYHIPNVKVDSYAVLTNNIYTGAMRSFGSMQVAVAYESQMDMLARELQMDSAEFRAKNYLKTGDETGTGQRIESEVLLAETQEAALKALEDRSEPRGPHIKVGRGLASSWQSYGRTNFVRDSASAWIRVEGDGSVILRCGIPDLGAGQRESLRQIAAELTGASLESVHVISTDPQFTPVVGGMVFATRALFMFGNAVKLAAEAIRHDLLQKASDMLGENHEHLDIRDGKVFASGNRESNISIAEVVKAIENEGNPLEVMKTFVRTPTRAPVTQEIIRGQAFPDFTFGSQAVEVEVDTLTGKVRVAKMVGAYDVGKAINPMRVEGQIEGGMTQGLGFALMEEFIEDKGVPKTVSLLAYMIPTAKDVPHIQSIIMESGSGKGPFGAKGIGEPTIVATAPAILNAIYDAVGVRIRETPATPERILKALGEKRDERF